MRDAHEALIVIDVQNDFCPKGALAVEGGDEIIEGINALMEDFQHVILTQDWHPPNHASFASNHEGAEAFSLTQMPYGPQVLWPDHCVIDSKGADFHPDLHVPAWAQVIRKGSNPEIDSYSAFFENDRVTPTGLQEKLDALGVTQLTIVGLAYDYCVAYSALDAARLGFKVSVHLDLSRAIDLNGSQQQATEQLLAAGVVLLDA